MTTKEKKQDIEDLCYLLNNTYLKPMKAEIAFSVDGTNKYSLILISNKKRLKDYGRSFYTYDDVLNSLKFILDIFDRATKEKNKK